MDTLLYLRSFDLLPALNISFSKEMTLMLRAQDPGFDITVDGLYRTQMPVWFETHDDLYEQFAAEFGTNYEYTEIDDEPALKVETLGASEYVQLSRLYPDLQIRTEILKAHKGDDANRKKRLHCQENVQGQVLWYGEQGKTCTSTLLVKQTFTDDHNTFTAAPFSYNHSTMRTHGIKSAEFWMQVLADAGALGHLKNISRALEARRYIHLVRERKQIAQERQDKNFDTQTN